MQNLAYLDAGSVNMIVPAILGSFVTVGVFFKMFGRRIIGLFRRSKVDQSVANSVEVGTVDATTTADEKVG